MKTTQKLERLADQINAVRYREDAIGHLAYVQVISSLKKVQVVAQKVPHAELLIDRIDALVWMLNEYLGAAVFSARHRSVLEEKVLDFNVIFDELRFLAKRAEPVRSDRYRSVHAQAA
jgi:hypothetical protein